MWKRAPKFRWKSVGYSLLEVLLALTIFSIGILGVATLQGISLMSADYGGTGNVARVLISDQLDRLQGLPYADPSLTICITAFCHADTGGGIGGPTGVNLSFTGAAEAAGRFRREWTVGNLSPATSNAKLVTVRVRWTDVAGGPTGAPPNSFNRSMSANTIKIQ